jgi:hypothetical protein
MAMSAIKIRRKSKMRVQIRYVRVVYPATAENFLNAKKLSSKKMVSSEPPSLLQVYKVIGLISQEKLNSRVSQIVSPQVYFAYVLYLPDQIVVR